MEYNLKDGILTNNPWYLVMNTRGTINFGRGTGWNSLQRREGLGWLIVGD